MKKLTCAALLSSIASNAMAEQYQTFGEIGLEKSDDIRSTSMITSDSLEVTIRSNSIAYPSFSPNNDTDNAGSISGQYYFSAKDTKGPLDQFSYIEDTTNIYASVVRYDNETSITNGGSYYFDRFAIGAYQIYYDDRSYAGLHADIFILSNLKFRLQTLDYKDVGATLQYEHKINGSDYFGITASMWNKGDMPKEISAKYFNALDNGQFIVIEAAVKDMARQDLTTMSASGNFYFNKFTNIEIGAEKNANKESVNIGANHFITKNFSIGGQVAKGEEDILDQTIKSTTYSLTAKLQM